MVQIAVPGDRWEVEFMVDGSVEVERFHSNGQIAGSAALEELFARFSDTGDGTPPSSPDEAGPGGSSEPQ